MNKGFTQNFWQTRLSDCVIAVAFTPFVVNIHMPQRPKRVSTPELRFYGLSLLIVGFYWLSHHHIYMAIKRHNMTLIWLNFAYLLFIELQPIINCLRVSYPTSQITSILYASE